MTQATFTFRVDGKLKEAFVNAVKAGDRTGAQLLRGFMRDYVRGQRRTESYDPWFHEQVQAGIREANDGLLISSTEIEAEAAAWRANAQKKLDAGDARKR